MANDPATVVEQAYAAVDRADADALIALLADDVEMADEVTKGWLRGTVAVAAYLRDALAGLSGIRSEVRDVAVRELGDTAVVSYAVTQRYPIDGALATVAGPGTVVLRRVAGGWRIALIQSTPFPAD